MECKRLTHEISKADLGDGVWYHAYMFTAERPTRPHLIREVVVDDLADFQQLPSWRKPTGCGNHSLRCSFNLLLLKWVLWKSRTLHSFVIRRRQLRSIRSDRESFTTVCQGLGSTTIPIADTLGSSRNTNLSSDGIENRTFDFATVIAKPRVFFFFFFFFFFSQLAKRPRARLSDSPKF